MAARSWSAVLAAVLLLVGCGSGNEDGSAPGLGKGQSWEEQRQKARAALARHHETTAESSRAPTVSPPAWDPAVTDYGLSIDSASVNVQGTRMTVSFTGSPGPAAQPCGADYAAEAAESDEAVVVIVLEQEHGSGDTCTMIGMTRTATLNLAKPLGNRVVLEIHGEPVSVTRTADTG